MASVVMRLRGSREPVLLSFSSYLSIVAVPPTFSIANFAEAEKACAVISNFTVILPLPKILTKSFFCTNPFLIKSFFTIVFLSFLEATKASIVSILTPFF